MEREIQQEIDGIVNEVVELRYRRDEGEDRVERAMRAAGLGGDYEAMKEGLRYYEQQCDSKGL